MEALEKQIGDLCNLVHELRGQVIPQRNTRPRRHSRQQSSKGFEDAFRQIDISIQRLRDNLNDLKASPRKDDRTRTPTEPTMSTAAASDGLWNHSHSRHGGISAESASSTSVHLSSHATDAALSESNSRASIPDERTVDTPASTSTNELGANDHSGSEGSTDTALTSLKSVHQFTDHDPLGEAACGATSQIDSCGERDEPFVLRPESMGDELVPTLMVLASDPRFRGKAVVDGPKQDISILRVDLGEGDYFGIQHSPLEGGKASNVWIAKKASSFPWPNFDELPGRPSAKEAREFLEDIVASPPEKPIDYYGGNAKSPLDNLLHPGRILAQSAELRDMKSTYYHIGAKGSATAFHCEDAEFWSCNIIDAGYKIWLIIEPHHTAMFEHFIQTNWTCGECDQFVRHLCLLVAPSRLRDEGIDFSIHCAGPGEMVVTRPRQYHAVVNYTSCFARSINFVPDEQALLPAKLVVCEQDGLYPLHKLHPTQVLLAPTTQPVLAPDGKSERQKKRKALPSTAENITQAKSARTKACARANTTTVSKIARLAESLLKQDPLLHLPGLDRLSNPMVLKLAAAVRGSSAAQQVQSLCQEQCQDKSTASYVVVRRTGNDDETWESQINYLRAATTGSAFQKFKIRLIEHSIARRVDEGKGRRRLRVDSSELDAIADQFWPENGGKKKLRYHLERGRKWLRSCGPFAGLLAYIPLNRLVVLGVSPKDYWALEDSDIESFHEMFTDDVGQTMCSMGKTVVETVLYGI